MINQFENCDCEGSCKQDGLLHWQILRKDYEKLHPDYKNCGIVFFVKEKIEDKTGKIIRNGVVYSGVGEDDIWIEGEKDQVLVSDGDGWAMPSPFYSTSNETENIIGTKEGILIPTVFTNDKDNYSNGGFIYIADTPHLNLTDTSALNIHGATTIDIGERGEDNVGGKFYNEELKGPTFHIHGAPYMDFDSGLNNVSPAIVLHGGMFIDISDGYNSPNGTYMGYNKYNRHPETGIGNAIPWDFKSSSPKPGPWLHMHDNASLVMDGGGLIKVAGNGALIADSHSRIAGYDNANVTFSGNSTVHFHNGHFIVNNGNFRMSDASEIHFENSCYFLATDSCDVKIGGSCNLAVFGSVNLDLTGSGTYHIGGTGNMNFVANGNFNITNGVSSYSLPQGVDKDKTPSAGGYYYPYSMKIDIHDEPNIQIDGHPEVQFRGRSSTRMMGSAYFSMENQSSYYSYDPKNSYGVGPSIMCTPEQFIFVGMGAKDGTHVSSNGLSRLLNPNGFDEKTWVDVDNSKNPILLVQGGTRFIIGSKGKTFFQIGGNEGEQLNVFIQGNTFMQTTGNAHLEMHNDSITVMRGHIDTKSAPALPSGYPNNRCKPWQDFCLTGRLVNEESRRPVQPQSDGPINSMYDSSIFIMRGSWDTTKDVLKDEEFTFELEDDDPLVNGTEELTIESLKENKSFIEAQQKTQKYYDSELEYTNSLLTEEDYNKVEHNQGETTITIKNYIFTTCPPDWSAEIPKRQDSPLLEISENAEVRVKGNIAIFADDSGITIKHHNLETKDLAESSDTIKFSFEELKKLKQYITETLMKSIS